MAGGYSYQSRRGSMSVTVPQLVKRPAFLPEFDAWPLLEGNRIAITGASGTLGKILCARLNANSIGYSAYDGDIKNAEQVYSWINGADPDVFIHLAAMVAVQDVSDNPSLAMNTNALSMLHLLDGVKSLLHPCWFFYASSSHVYPDACLNEISLPVSENTPTDPISLYGATKLAGESIAKAMSKHYQIPLCIGRIFSFYHHTQPESFLVPSLSRKIQEAAAGSQLELHNPDAIRDFLDAEMVVDAILWLSALRAEGIINIASGSGISVREIAKMISMHASKEIHFVESKAGAKSALVGDVRRLSELIGKFHG